MPSAFHSSGKSICKNTSTDLRVAERGSFVTFVHFFFFKSFTNCFSTMTKLRSIDKKPLPKMALFTMVSSKFENGSDLKIVPKTSKRKLKSVFDVSKILAKSSNKR